MMLFAIDVKTLIVVLVSSCALAALLLFLDSRGKATPFGWLFSLGLVFQSLAWTLIGLRGVVPDLLSFYIGNSIQFIGMGLLGIGLLSLKVEIRKPWILLFFICIAFILAVWWLPGLKNSTHIFLMSLFYPVLFIVPGWHLIVPKDKSSPLQRFTGAMLIFYSICMAARGVFVFIAGNYNLATPTFIQIFPLMLLFLVLILVAVSYILIRKEQANEELAKASEEKNLLLTELQHRVKNSLAMISSLTSLEKDRQEDSAFRASMDKVRDRIDAVAKLYDLLRVNDPRGGVSLGAYIGEVAEHLYGSYSSSPERIRLELDLEPMEVDAKTSVALGLIVNELATNAMKYAFPGDRKGRLGIGLASRDGKIELVVADDGVGMPEAKLGAEVEGLGTLIVTMLTRQIGGTLSLSSEGGTAYTITLSRAISSFAS